MEKSNSGANVSDAQNKFLADIRERAALCKDTRRANCGGTSMYLVQEQPADEYMRMQEVSARLKQLKRVQSPVLGGLAAWQFRDQFFACTMHLSVVVSLDPLLINHRNGCDGEFFESDSFSRMDAENRSVPGKIEMEYFLPRKLEEALASDAGAAKTPVLQR
ncbi:Uncharacterised protein [uncultured archaeon]|nr:Uncharacterised protein [uncultured archaeon]